MAGMRVTTAIPRRSLRRSATLTLLLAAGLLLAACGGGDQEAVDAYHRQVVDKLRGDPSRNTGLGQIVSLTLGDLNCGDESVCQNPVWFKFIGEEIPRRQSWVADFMGYVCRNDSVSPPASARQDHEHICANLDLLFNTLDSVLMNVSSVGLMLNGQTVATGIEPHVKNQLAELGRRIERKRVEIREIQDALRSIGWLEPAL